jgi:imidazolonepropionase-like amidohydrolase
MKKIWKVLLANFCLFSVGNAQTYITHVNLVDVEKKQVIPDQTVVIDGALISSVGTSVKIPPPPGATLINGKGKFIMPGLTDAHVHFFQNGGLYTRPDVINLQQYRPYAEEITKTHESMEGFLRRYLREGITTVFDVGSTYSWLSQRDTFQNKIYAPRIFMTGPLLTSYEPRAYKNLGDDEPFILVKTPEEGINAVKQELSHHPDFIKIWYIVNPDSVEASAEKFVPVLKAVIQEAHSNNLKVAVHATQMITAELAVENGCDYLVHDVDDTIVPDSFIKLLKDKRIILCPTLTVMDGYYKTFAQTNVFTYHDLTRANPEFLGTLTDLDDLPDSTLTKRYTEKFKSRAIIAESAHRDSVMKINLKRMEDAGITIVSGTDAGNIGTEHATSLFNELEAMKSSGLTNWQVIQSTTINPSKILDKENNFGSIAPGKSAELILLNGNPVDSLENLQKIDLIFNKGQVINPDTLLTETPFNLAQEQLNAYNSRDIDAFLQPYSDNVQLYQFPDILLSRGKSEIRTRMESLFKNYPHLHCQLLRRICQGNFVIDKEIITGTNVDKSVGTIIYEIKNSKIDKVYLML